MATREELPTVGGTLVTPAQYEMRPDATAPKWNSFDTVWLITLFGTAVGAGILVLPFKAGSGGVYPLILATILIGPMTYLAHRGLSRMVVAVKEPTADITEVARQYFGRGPGIFITIIYFLSIFPILMIYSVLMTNEISGIITDVFGWGEWPRWVVAAIVVASMSGVMIAGPKIVNMVTGWIVYPLILALGVLSVWLIPHWSFEGFTEFPSFKDFSLNLWLTIPALVFAFSFAAATSQLTVGMKQKYGVASGIKSRRVIRGATVLLTIFTMGFVWSTVLALGKEELVEGAESNISASTFLARTLDEPFIAAIGPIIAIIAIASSFFGHWLGAIEGGVGLVNLATEKEGRRYNQTTVRTIVIAFVVIVAWIVAILDPSVLDLIDALSGPVIAMVLYLLPMWAIRKAKVLEPYRGLISNAFVVVMGLIAVSGMIFPLIFH